MSRHLTAVIQREGDGYVAQCPELDVASQGDTVESARDNLREAVELFFECADPEEAGRRFCVDEYDDSPWTREELQALAWERVQHDGRDEYDDLPEKP